MKLLLKRAMPDERHNLMHGELFVDDKHECFTLERHPSDPEHPAIKAGTYPVTVYYSPRLKRNVLLLHDVPGREWIEIHNANFVSEVKGCIAVGRIRTPSSVIESVYALDALIDKVLGSAKGQPTMVRQEDVIVPNPPRVMLTIVDAGDVA